VSEPRSLLPEATSRISSSWIPPDFAAELRLGYETGGGRGYWEAWRAGLRSREEFRQRSFYMAIASAKGGHVDEAFEWLNRLVDERHPVMVQIPVTPSFLSLRSDPRFKELLGRLDLA